MKSQVLGFQSSLDQSAFFPCSYTSLNLPIKDFLLLADVRFFGGGGGRFLTSQFLL